MITRLRQQFSEMELTNKLGYIWLLCFFVMVLTVAAAIVIPIMKEKAAEEKPAEEEEGSSISRPVIEYRLASMPSEKIFRSSGIS